MIACYAKLASEPVGSSRGPSPDDGTLRCAACHARERRPFQHVELNARSVQLCFALMVLEAAGCLCLATWLNCGGLILTQRRGWLQQLAPVCGWLPEALPGSCNAGHSMTHKSDLQHATASSCLSAAEVEVAKVKKPQRRQHGV